MKEFILIMFILLLLMCFIVYSKVYLVPIFKENIRLLEIRNAALEKDIEANEKLLASKLLRLKELQNE